MTAEAVMPLPHAVGTASSQAAEDFELVAKAIANTQVADNPVDRVPSWAGKAKDAYIASIQKLGAKTRDLYPKFSTPAGPVRDWGQAVTDAIKTIEDDYWPRYNKAQADYDAAIADLNDRAEQARTQGEEIPASEMASYRAGAERKRDHIQDEVCKEYYNLLKGLNAKAQEAASSLKTAQDSVVEPDKQGSRESIAKDLFNDIPVVDGQVEWQLVQGSAKEAATYFNNPSSLSLEQLQEFNNKYGEALSNPFFAQALSQYVSPEDTLKFYARTEAFRSRVSPEIDQWLTGFSSSLGEATVLSMGGMNTEPGLFETQDSFSLVRAGLRTASGGSVNDLINTRLQNWKTVGNQLYGPEMNVLDPAQAEGRGGVTGNHYGHEYLSALLGLAAHNNQSLALGPEFFRGDQSLAHDIVTFDRNHRAELTATGKYGDWGNALPPGGDRLTTDPVESMLKLSDEPLSLSDGTLTADTPAWERMQAKNLERLDGVREFANSKTGFEIDPASEPTRYPPFTEKGPMNMTRYLTGFRNTHGRIGLADGMYTGTQDYGESLGRVLAQAAAGVPEAEGLDSTSPDFDAWNKRAEQSRAIAANFMLGYQEGLEINGSRDLIEGQDPFGMEHAGLRNWGGVILAPHIDDLANLVGPVPRSSGFPFPIPEPYEASKSTAGGAVGDFYANMKDRILGKNGLLTDFAFDQPVDYNNTPDDPTDDRTVSGRESAGLTLRAAAEVGHQRDMKLAMESGDVRHNMTAAQKKWAGLKHDLMTAPAGADAQVGAAMDLNNRRWKSVITTVVDGATNFIPYGKVLGEGKVFEKWLVGQATTSGTAEALDAIFPEGNEEKALEAQKASHRAAEIEMQNSIYQAISEGNYWGEDPARHPQQYLETIGVDKGSKRYFMKDPEGVEDGNPDDDVVIPYNQMTVDQVSAFNEYLTSHTGLGGIYGDALTESESSLDIAKDELKEAWERNWETGR